MTRPFLALATLLVSSLLWSCGATMPERTGYDRRTGTWKPPSSRHGQTKVSAAAPAPSAVATPASPRPAPAEDSTVAPPPPSPPDVPTGEVLKGEASFYGKELAGRRTASGEIFDPDLLTCAHRTLPFGTRLKVSYPKKGTTVEVRINDRGPHKPQRILDLSRGAADVLGLTADGIGQVEAEILP